MVLHLTVVNKSQLLDCSVAGMQSGVGLWSTGNLQRAPQNEVYSRQKSRPGGIWRCLSKPTSSSSSRVTEETALGALCIHVSPVRQDEGQVSHTALQQHPQVLSNKLVSPLGEMQPVRQIDGVVLRGESTEL